MADDAEIQTFADDGAGSGFSARDAAAEVSARRSKAPEVTEVAFRDGRTAPDSLTPRQAGEELEKYRLANPDPLDEAANRPSREIQYIDPDPKYDQRTARQAGKDLADFRAKERAALEAQLDGDLAQLLQQPAAEQAEQQPQPEPEQPAAQPEQLPSSADLLAHVDNLDLENPDQRAAAKLLIAHAAQQRAVETQQTADAVWNLQHQTGTAYTQAVQQLEDMTAAALVAEYGGVDPAALSQQDPAKFARLQRMAQVYNGINQQKLAQQEASRQLYQQQWSSWAAQQDALAAKAIPETNDPKFQAMVPEILMNDYGFQRDDLAKIYYGPGRDARVKRIFADAMKYRLASKTVATPARKPLPPVQRPGTSQPYAPTERHDLRGMEKKLTVSGNLKDAASLLIARRARNE